MGETQKVNHDASILDQNLSRSKVASVVNMLNFFLIKMGNLEICAHTARRWVGGWGKFSTTTTGVSPNSVKPIFWISRDVTHCLGMPSWPKM